MKKLATMLLLVVLACTGLHAQNANRTGFFLEAAIGGTTGDTPLVGLSLDGSDLMAHYAGGASFNIAFGPRFRTSNHWAFDLRFEIQSPTAYVSCMPTGKLMPAVRYISPEIFGNMSLYGTIGIGGAISPSYTKYPDDMVLSSEMKKFSFSDADVMGGVSYLIGVGLNVTTHFYAGFMYDAQYIVTTSDIYYKDKIHWGMAGLQLGYRF